MPDLPIIAPTLPEGFCPSTWQQLVNEAVGKAVAQFDGSGFTVIINQEAVPAVTDQDKLWRRPSQANRGLYQYSGGAWVVIHPYPASGSVAGFWVEATPAEIWAFDGGDGTDPAVNPPTANNGAMWVIDTNYAGRSPMGVGTIPTANPAKVLAVGENYGEGSHTMTDQEVGPHTHPLTSDVLIADGPRVNVVNTGVGGAGLAVGLTGPALQDLAVGNNTYTTVQQTMPVIHPVRGQYYIVRSARVNYVGS